MLKLALTLHNPRSVDMSQKQANIITAVTVSSISIVHTTVLMLLLLVFWLIL